MKAAPIHLSRAIVAATLLLGAAMSHAQTRLFVNVTAAPGGDGTSWTSAFNSFSAALGAVSDPATTEIWIASGTYRPSGPEEPGRAVFVVPPGLQVLGGFTGVETLPDQRPQGTGLTVLSGDVNGDDVPFSFVSGNLSAIPPAPPDRLDNRGPVVSLTGSSVRRTLLDRVTVTGGYAPSGGGAAVILNQSNTLVRDCVFSDSMSAGFGAPVFTVEGNHMLVGCTLDRNRSFSPSAGLGGGLAGGALCANFFTTVGSSAVAAFNCRFMGNVCDFGSVSSINFQGSTGLFANCTVTGGVGGAAVSLRRSIGPATSIVFTSSSVVANTTLPGQGVGGLPPGLLISSQTSSTAGIRVENCIVRYNLPPEFPLEPPSPVLPDIRISGASGAVVQFCNAQVAGGSGALINSTAPPLLVQIAGFDGIVGTADDSPRLIPSSPCIDSGNELLLPLDVTDIDADSFTNEPLPFDIDGMTRVIDDPLRGDPSPFTPLDVGASESQAFINSLVLEGGTASPADGSVFDGIFATRGVSRITGATPGAAITANPVPGDTAGVRIGGDPYVTVELQLDDARILTSGDVVIGDRASGASGRLQISRPPTNDVISCARLVLSSGRGLSVSGPAQITCTNRLLIGATSAALNVDDLTLLGSVENQGVIILRQSGSFLISGNLYMSTPLIPGDSEPGLRFEFDPASGAGQMSVQGTMSLRGNVSLLGQSQRPPSIGASYTLLSAASRTGLFGTAFLPGYPDRVLRLIYSNSARSAEVAVQVEPASNVLNLNPPLGFPVPGSPSAAALGTLHAAPYPHPDLAVVAPDESDPAGSPGTLNILINQGTTANAWNGYAAVTITKPTGAAPSGVVIADFDGDTLSDIAVSNRSDSTVGVYLNTGADDFSSPVIIPTSTGPACIGAADVDGDGDTDLVTATSAGKLDVLLNDGTASFSPAADPPVSIGASPTALTVTDLDGRGGPDVAVTDSAGNNVAVITNGGSSPLRAWLGFLPARFFAAGDEPSSIQPGNVDNGKENEESLAVTNFGSGTVTILLPDGAGGYNASTGPIGEHPRSIALTDVDSDGRADVVAVAENPDTGLPALRVLTTGTLPGGGISFTQTTDVPTSTPPAIVLTGDLDNDGTPDLVSVGPQTATRPAPDAPAARGTTANVSAILVPPPCPGDITRDGAVNTSDLIVLLLYFGQPAPQGSPADAADLNTDSSIDTSDLILLLVRFGQPCP